VEGSCKTFKKTELMKEFINNFFQISNERLKNPLLFSFLFSWIAFNWRPIFTVLLSGKKIEDKITYITENFSQIEYNLYYPLFFSLGYVILLPYLTWIVEILAHFAKSGRKENLVNEQLSDLASKQKIAKAEYKYEQEKAGNVEISQLNNKIEELSNSNEKKQKLIESLKIDLNTSKKEKNKLEQYINLESPDDAEYSEELKNKLNNEYKEFLKTEVSTYFEKIGTEISQFKSIPKDTDSIIIEKLIYSGLIKRVDDEENQRVYYLLTKKGKYFWKNYVLSKNVMTQEEWDKRNDLPF
jgi:DNA-binding MarR family transcriptional regulator